MYDLSNKQIICYLVFIFNAICVCSSSIPDVTALADAELIIDLPNGKIRGKFNDDFYSYESIPYAEPPVGVLRFESPKPYTTAWQGIRDATQAPIPCMQWDQYFEGDGHGVEDCLTVNVYKPLVATTTNSTLPVLILIHGGAFMFGNANSNNHERIMKRKHFIVVKMHYRVGPLGFLSTEDAVISGNFGLKDQRLALQWTKMNIARFGGDPERIFLIGFSAGAAAVHMQMLQEDFSQYAKVAAALSGTVFNPWVIQRSARAHATDLAKSLNCTNTESSVELKRCLQSADAARIVTAVRNFLIFGYNPFTTFGPVIESADVVDAFLKNEPAHIIQSGRFGQVPFLVSYTAQDGGYNAAELLQVMPGVGKMMIDILNERWLDLAPYTLFYKDTITSVEKLDEYSTKLKERYLGDKNISMDTYFAVQKMYTDVLFKDGVEQTLRLHSKFSTKPVYAYIYDNPAEKSIATVLSGRQDIQFGTIHGDDFFLIFPGPARLPELSEDEDIMSDKLNSMLENFLDESYELKFDSCKFVDNVNKDNLQLMKITKDKCEPLSVQEFP